MKKTSKKGFTLIELIVVIAILGILAAILIPQFVGFQDKARVKAAVSEAASVATAIDAYYAESGVYPTDTTKSDLDISSAMKENITNLETDGGFTYTHDNGKQAGRADAASPVAEVAAPAATTTTE